MSTRETGEGTEPLSVRRPVELPEADIDPTVGPTVGPVAGRTRDGDASADPPTRPTQADPTQADPTQTAPSQPDPSAAATDASRQTDGTANATTDPTTNATTDPTTKETTAPATTGRDIATAPAAAPTAVAGDGMPPDRPKKPVLAAVAIGGAVVLAVPILLIGTGSHHVKQHRTAIAADTVLPGDAQQPPPGAFVSASPMPMPTPTPAASPSATPSPKKAGPKPAKHAKHARARAAAVFTGAADVFVKNAASGLCADLPNYGPGTIDGPVNQYHCRRGDTDNQVWTLEVAPRLRGPGGVPLFVVRNDMDDHCMDLPFYGGHPAGTKVTEYYCRPSKSDNQLWYRTHTSGSRYRLHNYASDGLCLGVTSRSHDVDEQLEIHKCGRGDDWSFPKGT